MMVTCYYSVKKNCLLLNNTIDFELIFLKRLDIINDKLKNLYQYLNIINLQSIEANKIVFFI